MVRAALVAACADAGSGNGPRASANATSAPMRSAGPKSARTTMARPPAVATSLFVCGLPQVHSGETTIMASGGAAVRAPLAASSDPVIVAGQVAVAGYAILAAFALTIGALLTHVLVDGWLREFDHDVVRSLAGSRTPTWNTLSNIGSNLAGGITVPIVA